MLDYSIGVDVGKLGAIVALDNNRKILFKKEVPLIAKDVDIRKYTKYLLYLKKKFKGKSYMVYIEQVHAIFGSSAHNTFQFGRQSMIPEVICSILGMPFTLVQPKEWQKEAWAGIKPIRKPDKKDKNGRVRKGSVLTKDTSSIAVQRLFPSENFKIKLKKGYSKNNHDGIVDACLIAYYGIAKQWNS